jgi:hypothetical protein
MDQAAHASHVPLAYEEQQQQQQQQFDEQYHLPALEQQPYYYPSHPAVFDSGDGWVRT